MSTTDDKRLRREIANSNERRRMQSINAGFIALRQLLPLSEGEKLSKAAILQLTAKYINVLTQEKSRLLQQNNKLKELLQQQAAGSCTFAGRNNTTVTLGDDSVTNNVTDSIKDTPARIATTAGCTSARVSIAAEHEPTNVVAQEVTVGDAPQPVSTRAQAHVLAQSGLHDAQMNLPLRKRKRTFSLSVEASVTPAANAELPTGSDLAGTGTCTDSGGDTDADAYSGTPSSASTANRTCGTARPRDVPTSSAASDADSVAMTADRYRFVPSAPLPTAPMRDAVKSEPNEQVATLGVANSYGGTMLLSANAPNQAPFRFDVISSVQPTGLLLSAASNAQRYESMSFEPSYSSVVSPPVALCSSGVHQAPPASVECSSTSITKKNLETIFEAIRHLEGDDLSLGESPPCATQPPVAAKYQQRVGNGDAAGSKHVPQPSGVVNAASTMLVPLAASDSTQPQTAFLVCLSPASLALSPSSGHASAEFAQNTGVPFNMGAALNTMMSPVSVGVTGSASCYVSSRTPQLLVNVPGATVSELDPTMVAYPAAAVACGGLPSTSRHV